MKKRIIITETDESVDVELFCRELHDKDWRLLKGDNEVEHFGGVIGFYRLFHPGVIETKLKHVNARRNNIDYIEYD